MPVDDAGIGDGKCGTMDALVMSDYCLRFGLLTEEDFNTSPHAGLPKSRIGAFQHYRDAQIATKDGCYTYDHLLRRSSEQKNY